VQNRRKTMAPTARKSTKSKNDENVAPVEEAVEVKKATRSKSLLVEEVVEVKKPATRSTRSSSNAAATAAAAAIPSKIPVRSRKAKAAEPAAKLVEQVVEEHEEEVEPEPAAEAPTILPSAEAMAKPAAAEPAAKEIMESPKGAQLAVWSSHVHSWRFALSISVHVQLQARHPRRRSAQDSQGRQEPGSWIAAGLWSHRADHVACGVLRCA
jgi:hypothetical protein